MLQLIQHVLNNDQRRLPQPGKQIPEPCALLAVAVDDRPDILIRIPPHQRRQRRSFRPLPLLLHFPQDILQQIVDKRPHLRRLEIRLCPFPGPQAVLHEIAEVTALHLVQPRGGHGQRTAVQAVYRPG